MRYSIVKHNQINTNLFRLDAEHHVGMTKINIFRLPGYKLKDLCTKIVQGPNPKFVDSGIPSFNGKNLYFGTLDAGEPNYISEIEYDSFKPYHLKKNDILITLKHASRVGRLWVYRKDEKRLFSRNLGLIRLKKDSPICHETIISYLWCFGSQELLNLIATGGTNGQITLSMAELREFPVPKFSTAIQKILVTVFKSGEEFINKSEEAYLQAQTLLLSELGFLNWQPKHRLSFVKNYSDAQEAGRIDAEYFQPKYDELMEITSSNNGLYIKKVSEIQTWNARGLQPQYIEGGLLDVVTSKHILENGIDYDSLEKTHEANWEFQKKARINKGDILTYTTGANIGRTACYSSSKRALASNHVNILRIKNERPEYVAFVMNSIIGRLQTERLSAGSAQEELYPKDIEQFVIPFIDAEKQNKIISLMGESDHLKIQSKHLLECAKRAVEIAIEQDEQAAIKWLENELKETER